MRTRTRKRQQAQMLWENTERGKKSYDQREYLLHKYDEVNRVINIDHSYCYSSQFIDVNSCKERRRWIEQIEKERENFLLAQSSIF